MTPLDTAPAISDHQAPVEVVLGIKGREVYWVAPHTTVLDAITTLAHHDIGALLVMDGRRLIGVFSERDYSRHVVLKGRTSRDTRVSEVMSEQLVTVTRTTSVAECLRLMTDWRIRHLPVLDYDTVVGIVSIGDLVSFVMRSQHDTIAHLRGYIDGRYPG